MGSSWHPDRCLAGLRWRALAAGARRWAAACAASGSLLAFPAAAHEVDGLDAHSLLQAWSAETWLWLAWLLPGLLVLVGIGRLWARAGAGAGVPPAQAACFVAGWLALGLSLLSPLDALGEEVFWAHMVQHEVVMLVAAPLLVLGRPLGPLTWGLPVAWRAPAARLAGMLGLSAAMRGLTRPLAAWWTHAVTLWAWHVPFLFQAALRERWVHELQHASFFIGALVFWWALLHRSGGERRGGAVLYMFTTLVHTSILGALLTFSGRTWYPAYEATAPAWGLTALQDQQLGGLIMWVPGGVVYLVAGLALCARLLQEPARGGERVAAAAD